MDVKQWPPLSGGHAVQAAAMLHYSVLQPTVSCSSEGGAGFRPA